MLGLDLARADGADKRQKEEGTRAHPDALILHPVTELRGPSGWGGRLGLATADRPNQKVATWVAPLLESTRKERAQAVVQGASCP
jgi:hypothetical protein